MVRGACFLGRDNLCQGSQFLAKISDCFLSFKPGSATWRLCRTREAPAGHLCLLNSYILRDKYVGQIEIET
jgi:hypothetical protein